VALNLPVTLHCPVCCEERSRPPLKPVWICSPCGIEFRVTPDRLRAEVRPEPAAPKRPLTLTVFPREA
jgi:hypothetical protein